jgi:hypothetical protein
MVWDNFESAAGIPGTEVTPRLPAADLEQLKTLLRALRGGRSRLLLTSRSPEPWLGVGEAYRLPPGGLQGEERWDYCNAGLADLGLKPDREDPHFAALGLLDRGLPEAFDSLLQLIWRRAPKPGLGALGKEHAGTLDEGPGEGLDRQADNQAVGGRQGDAADYHRVKQGLVEAYASHDSLRKVVS